MTVFVNRDSVNMLRGQEETRRDDATLTSFLYPSHQRMPIEVGQTQQALPSQPTGDRIALPLRRVSKTEQTCAGFFLCNKDVLVSAVRLCV
jgi:hypothetical protein